MILKGYRVHFAFQLRNSFNDAVIKVPSWTIATMSDILVKKTYEMK